MKQSTKNNIIAGLWGAAAAATVVYVQTVVQEHRKRKAIEKWKDETIEKIQNIRKEKDKTGYSPMEVLVEPVSEVLAEELKNWTVEPMENGNAKLHLKDGEEA